MSKTITPKDARAILWKKGDIRYLLDSNQLQLRDSWINSPSKIIVWGCSRQLGKSYTLCALAIEACLKEKNSIVKFVSPTQRMVKLIIKPIMRQLTKDCPLEIRPEYKVADGMYVFKNGSELQISGADAGRAENIRGGKANLVLVDEAGFITDLEYIINSILLPTTTMTRGKIIIASTPPKSASHDFVTFLRQASYEGSYVHKTIYDNPRLTKQDIDDFAHAAGGYNSINFRREYMAEIITDDTSAIIPEFASSKELQSRVIKEWPRPPFIDPYVSMDLGVKDLTVVLFGYYDFRAAKLIIEDEFVINGQKFNTVVLADTIKRKEQELFKDAITGEHITPYKRVSDNNLIVIQDLWQLHGLLFHPTKKDDNDAALNNLRIMIESERFIINPRCVTLIRHLREGTWIKSKKSFERSGDNGHFDAIDSAKYLVRNINEHHNPYPFNYDYTYSPSLYEHRKRDKTPNIDAVKQIVNMKKR